MRGKWRQQQVGKKAELVAAGQTTSPRAAEMAVDSGTVRYRLIMLINCGNDCRLQIMAFSLPI